MPGEIVHFDIPVDDVERAVDFYTYVMGWKVDKYGGPDVEAEPGMEYYLTSPSDDENAVGGGIGKKMNPGQTRVNYYNAEGGLEAFNQRVKDKGGMVLMEKMPVPGMGWFSVCADPEGNQFGGWMTDYNATM